MELESLLNKPVLPVTQEAPTLSVSELSRHLKRNIESSYANINVKGEISGFKKHSSGHGYFAIKDSEAVLDAVCWKGILSSLDFYPADGMEVICTGKLTIYPGRSKYQMVVTHIQISGHGSLLKLLEERKQRLLQEGLFSQERKKPLPFLPQIIGLVTSPTGAVLRDIIHRINDRFPLRVILWPTAVQGKGAETQISNAIDGFNKLAAQGRIPTPDLLIVARGGGSLEDLWCFNEECVVRSVAASNIPIISAVGHETDITLIDYAADKRAPTPTAAAEMAVPVRQDLLFTVHERYHRMSNAVNRYLTICNERSGYLSRSLPDMSLEIVQLSQRIDDLADKLAKSFYYSVLAKHQNLAQLGAQLRHPQQQIAHQQLALNGCYQKLNYAYQTIVQHHSAHLSQLGSLLVSYSYHGTLQRGFALISTKDGVPITQIQNLNSPDLVNITLQDGSKSAQII